MSEIHPNILKCNAEMRVGSAWLPVIFEGRVLAPNGLPVVFKSEIRMRTPQEIHAGMLERGDVYVEGFGNAQA